MNRRNFVRAATMLPLAAGTALRGLGAAGTEAASLPGAAPLGDGLLQRRFALTLERVLRGGSPSYTMEFLLADVRPTPEGLVGRQLRMRRATLPPSVSRTFAGTVFFGWKTVRNVVSYGLIIPHYGGAGRIKVRRAEAPAAEMLLSFIAIDFFSGTFRGSPGPAHRQRRRA